MGINKYYLITTTDSFKHKKVIRARWYHKWFGLPRNLLDVVYADTMMQAGQMFVQRHQAVVYLDVREMRGAQ